MCQIIPFPTVTEIVVGDSVVSWVYGRRGTKVRPVTVECPICLEQVRRAELYCHKCEEG
jgi:hypothetical protein